MDTSERGVFGPSPPSSVPTALAVIPEHAGAFLDDWCRRVMRSRIKPMMAMAKSFRVHRHLILNHFRACKVFSSGVVEGLNNKAKVGMRRAYGNRSDDVLEVALFHQLGALP